MLVEAELRGARDVAGRGWGAVMAWALVLTFVLMMLAFNRGRPGVWPDAAGYLVATGVAMLSGGLFARPGDVTRGAVWLGRGLWTTGGLVILATGLDYSRPELGAKVLVAPGAVLCLGVCVWLLFSDEAEGNRRSQRLWSAVTFANGFPLTRRI